MTIAFVPAMPAFTARSRNCALYCDNAFAGRRLLARRVSTRAKLHMCNPPPSTAKKNFPREMTPQVKELRSVLKKCSIYLVGTMGSGKSAIGKYLAYELGFRFLDIDELIEAAAKKTISEIFKEDGEEAFRDLESEVLDHVQAFIGCCVSTGGGAVLRKSNWGKLQTGIVVYLEAPVEVLVDRLKDDKTRPLLADAEDLTERISSILNDRRSLYEQADVTVPIKAGDAVDDIGKDLIRRVTNFIKANPPRLSKLYPGNLPKAKGVE